MAAEAQVSGWENVPKADTGWENVPASTPPSGSAPAFDQTQAPGLVTPGNIDIFNRPQVKNPDGSISTVRSMSFNMDGREVLVPTVSDDGRIMSDDEAVDTYRKTGKHLGIFDTPQNATAYSQRLHNQQDAFYRQPAAPPPQDLTKPLVELGQANFTKQQRPVTNFSEAIEAGWGMSVSQLAASGRLPDVALTDDAPWYLRAASGFATLAGDSSWMMAGAALGGSTGGIGLRAPGAAIGAMGGAVALPAGLRYVLVDAIQRGGQSMTRAQIVDLAVKTMWETTKGWITGAATAQAGVTVKAVLPAATSTASKAVVPTAAELATMVAVGKALEGELPASRDWLDGAIVLFGAKGAVQGVAKLQTIWAQTGMRPEQVVADAQREPGIWQDVLSEKSIPDAYRNKVEPRVKTTVETPSDKGPTLKTEPATKTPGEPTLSPEAEAKAIAFFERPFPEVPMGASEPPRPTHVNYKYQDTPQAVKEAEQKLSELYEARIQEQRRGTVSWEQTYKESAEAFAELLGVEPGKVAKALEKDTGSVEFSKLAANMYARKEIATGVAEELMRKREALVAKGADVTVADRLEFIAAMENAGDVLAGYLGARAETGRALNILKSTRRDAEHLKAIKQLLDDYGGEGKVDKIVEMLGDMKKPGQALKFARDATKATKWDMVIEAYRASLISGVTTAQVNVISTTLFTAMRLPIRTVAGVFGKLHGGDKVHFGESVGVATGWWAGVRDAAVAVAATAKGGYVTAKDKGFIAAGREAISKVEAASEGVAGEKTASRKAIPGPAGEVVRAPFLALSLPDLFLKTLNNRAELHALAMRDAFSKNLTYNTPEFNAHVARIINDPPPEIAEAATKAGFRNSFNAEPGEISAAAGKLIKVAHLEPIIPFRRTVGNLFKEGARMTPGLNFAVKEWREDYKAGGARRDMALAEVTVGATLFGAFYIMAENGMLTGNGAPDPNQRATDRGANWKPYAAKFGDQYIDGYQRMAPFGMLAGMAADMSEIKQYMSQEEHDQLARMIMTAFAKNVTNPTFMTGATNLIKALDESGNYVETYLEMLAGSVVPGLLAQTAREQDPLIREIHGAMEAVRSRIPYWREGLMPKVDVWGEPIKAPERLWAFSPFSTSQVSGDKVRTEAMRIGFATAPTPKRLEVGPTLMKEKVQLTPEQRDVYATTAGQLAHKMLEVQVNSPGWNKIPDLMKRRIYETTYSQAREWATLQALTPEGKAETIERAASRLLLELRK